MAISSAKGRPKEATQVPSVASGCALFLHNGFANFAQGARLSLSDGLCPTTLQDPVRHSMYAVLPRTRRAFKAAAKSISRSFFFSQAPNRPMELKSGDFDGTFQSLLPAVLRAAVGNLQPSDNTR